ncbi:MAG TPA: hypothetical protein VLE02_05135 [Nitrosarchaeum sp.]|nr:hypothetical protein [Nitrosarchaeum sp.]
MKAVEPIELTDEEKKNYTELEIQIFDITNKLMKSKLCGLQLDLGNGWKVSLKNKRFAKQIGVPM